VAGQRVVRVLQSKRVEVDSAVVEEMAVGERDRDGR